MIRSRNFAPESAGPHISMLRPGTCPPIVSSKSSARFPSRRGRNALGHQISPDTRPFSATPTLTTLKLSADPGCLSTIISPGRTPDGKRLAVASDAFNAAARTAPILLGIAKPASWAWPVVDIIDDPRRRG